MKKSARIAIIIAITLCAGLLITAVVMFGSKGLEGGNKDCRYPYKWKGTSQGKLSVAVAAPKAEGKEWELEGVMQNSSLQIDRLESEDRSLELLVTPLSAGIQSFTVSCKDDNEQLDMTLYITLFVDADLSISDVKVGELDYGPVASGEIDNCQYTLHKREDGGLDLRLNYLNDSYYSWKTEALGYEGLEVSFDQREESKQHAVISLISIAGSNLVVPEEAAISSSAQEDTAQRGGAQKDTAQSGSAQEEPAKNLFTVQLLGRDSLKLQDIRLTLSLELSSHAITNIESHTVETVKHVTKADIAAQTATQAEKLIGRPIKAIDKAEGWKCAIKGSSEDKDQRVIISFELDKILYECSLSKEQTKEEILSRYFGEWTPSKETVKALYTVFNNPESIALSWETDDGVTYVIVSSKTTTVDKLIAIAEMM